jgi:hypothetical protein
MSESRSEAGAPRSAIWRRQGDEEGKGFTRGRCCLRYSALGKTAKSLTGLSHR